MDLLLEGLRMTRYESKHVAHTVIMYFKNTKNTVVFDCCVPSIYFYTSNTS